MEHCSRLRLGRKGQVTIEFMLLLTLIMIYLTTIVQPSLAVAESAVKDASGLAKARLAAEKLANAVNGVGVSSGEARRSISLFIPKNAEISCASTADAKPAIKMSFRLQRESAACGTANPPTDPDMDGSAMTCTKLLRVEAKGLSCSPEILTGSIVAIVSKDASGAVNVSGQ